MKFEGFPAEAFAFYKELRTNNSREWWPGNKDRYERFVREPLEALAAELEPEFGPIKTFRPFRDVRFSRDKTPYQDHASLALNPTDGQGTLYFQFSDRGLFLAGGYYRPAKDQLDRFRALVDDTKAVEDLDILVEDLAANGFPLGDPQALKTAPRGWSKEHPRIELLRRTSLVVSQDTPPSAWMSTPECLEHVTLAWRQIKRWGDWLNTNVGASTIPVTDARGTARRGGTR